MQLYSRYAVYVCSVHTILCMCCGSALGCMCIVSIPCCVCATHLIHTVIYLCHNCVYCFLCVHIALCLHLWHILLLEAGGGISTRILCLPAQQPSCFPASCTHLCLGTRAITLGTTTVDNHSLCHRALPGRCLVEH